MIDSQKQSKEKIKKTKRHQIINIVDTNILFLWASHMAGFLPEWPGQEEFHRKHLQKKQAKAAYLCENSKQTLIIPPLVWVELYGVFLQKDIDLKNYELWRRQRKAALQPIEEQLYNKDTHIEIGEELFVAELAVDFCQIKASKALLSAMQRIYAGRTYPDGRQSKIKCLDGIDSAILAYAWHYARQNPNDEVWVLSDDNGFRLMREELHRQQKRAKDSHPSNLGYKSVWGKRKPYALFPTISVHKKTHPRKRKTSKE